MEYFQMDPDGTLPSDCDEYIAWSVCRDMAEATVPSAASSIEPVLPLIAERDRLCHKAESEIETDDEIDEIIDRTIEIERQIAATPATTLRGAVEKLLMFARESDPQALDGPLVDAEEYPNVLVFRSALRDFVRVMAQQESLR